MTAISNLIKSTFDDV